ncbi:MAG TPA: DNA translocase FtsK 4TM domain-containing protein [Paenalcaligenes sp.]|nr:DNA translocase FtsK 4TM domain-containing protein [Paenalcaligenes sp.]
MARIPATSNRSSKNVRNGPSALQLRVSSLVREARWLLFVVLAAWLGLVLSTWDPADPSWTQSLHAGSIKNKGGTFGANVSSFLYFFFGYSAWLWVILLLTRVVAGFHRLTHIVLPQNKNAHELPRVKWEVAAGFVLLLVCCMGLEAMQRATGSSVLPAGPGGQLGQLMLRLLVTHLGSQGGALLLIAGAAIGASLFFGFSWLNTAEKLGFYLEKIWLGAQGWWAQRVAAQAAKPAKAEKEQTTTQKKAPAAQVPAEPARTEKAVPTDEATPKKARKTLRDLFARRTQHKTDEPRSEPSLSDSTQQAASESQRREPSLTSAQPAAKEVQAGTTQPQTTAGGAATATSATQSSSTAASKTAATKTAATAVSSDSAKPIEISTLEPTPPAIQSGRKSRTPQPAGLPTLDLLDAPDALTDVVSADTLEYTARLIEKRLADFGVKVTVETARSGPVITRYEIEPATGVKGSQIVNLAKDLARSLSLVNIRVVETIPGKNLMGLELPNPKRQMVRIQEIIGDKAYEDSKSKLTLVLGKGIAGKAVVTDLAKMPHLLVAGTTGSGKSVAINAMLLSILYGAKADEVRLILIDPKMLEMSVYEGIPHLLAPVVTDMTQAANALNWCVNEMERRYRLMSKLGVRNLAGYNDKVKEANQKGEPIPNPFSLTPDEPEPLSELPFIVVVIDELADLMMVAGKKIEELIARLAQKARAAGIHLVLATQRPSVDVITGLIKANIPTRISFQVSSRVDSRTILDQAGAETLLGQGDMLFLPPGTSVPIRVHGAFVDDDEVHRVVEYLKEQGEPDYVEGILEGGVPGETGDGVNPITGFADAESDPLYDQAVAFVLESGRASTSGVQRHLRVGYNRAARIIEQMEQVGIVSPMRSNGTREILAPRDNADAS